MAVTPGTGGTGTVDNDGGTIYSASGKGVTSIQVWNLGAAASSACKVQVTGVHDSSATGLHLEGGKTTIVRFGDQRLKECKVFSATDAATAEVAWGVVAVVGAAGM